MKESESLFMLLKIELLCLNEMAARKLKEDACRKQDFEEAARHRETERDAQRQLEEYRLSLQTLLSSEPNDEVSDTTGDDSSTKAG